MGSEPRAKKALYLERAHHAREYALECSAEEVSNTAHVQEHALTYLVSTWDPTSLSVGKPATTPSLFRYIKRFPKHWRLRSRTFAGSQIKALSQSSAVPINASRRSSSICWTQPRAKVALPRQSQKSCAIVLMSRVLSMLVLWMSHCWNRSTRLVGS